jgi:hypothetical protein
MENEAGVKEREESREEYRKGLARTYAIKNRGMEIKIEMMETLHKRFMELDREIDAQSLEGKIHTLGVMAQIGAAVIPD